MVVDWSRVFIYLLLLLFGLIWWGWLKKMEFYFSLNGEKILGYLSSPLLIIVIPFFKLLLYDIISLTFIVLAS